MQFWPILGPCDPLKSPLYYQRSTLNGSCSHKILHKIVLPENVFISIFFEVKMIEKCQKRHISCNLNNFGIVCPTQMPLILPTKYFKWLIFSQNTPENSTTRKWIHFYLFWSENDLKVLKMSYFMQFWTILGPYHPLKCPDTTNKVL